MFDVLLIDDEEYQIFFDKENMKFYIEYNLIKNFKEYIKKRRFIKISKYLLCLSEEGYYNEGNYVYNILYYLGFEYNDFELNDLKEITFESKKISELFYLKNKRPKKLVYNFDMKDEKFNIRIIASNKLENVKYGELNSESKMIIDIIKCDSYEGLDRIIKSVLNLLAILAVDMEIKNCNIYIKNKNNNRGDVVFKKVKQKGKYIDANFSMGNLWFLEKYINNIFTTIYETPNLNLYFLSCYQLEYDNYDFFKIYSCYEFEYSKIDKEKLYNHEDISIINEEKTKALSIIGTQCFSEKLQKYISNYNPLEGHKQKLRNGFNYIRSTMYKEYDDLEFENLIEDIYKMRINITHYPSEDFIIRDTEMVRSFTQSVYILLLKRCGVCDKTIKNTIKDFFIPVA